MSDQDKFIPSSITPQTTTAPEVIANEVSTNKFTLSSRTVERIEDDFTITDPKALYSAAAIKQGYNDLERIVDDLNDKMVHLELTPVLSNALLNPFFSDISWAFDGFYIDANKAIYVSSVPPVENQAGLRIKNSAITSTGTHFFNITVDRLDGGYLTVQNQFGEVAKTIQVRGNEKFEVEVLHPSTEYFDILLHSMPEGGVCTISSIYLHHVKHEFSEYSEYLTESALSGGSGLVSQSELTELLDKTLNDSKTYTETLVSISSGGLGNHILDVNPHGITPEGIGAAPDEHTHAPSECGAAPSTHSHNLTDVYGLETELDKIDTFNLHVSSTDNPHFTTKEHVGLGNLENYTIATDAESVAGASSERYLTPAGLQAYMNNYGGMASGIAGNTQANLKIHHTIDTLNTTVTFTVSPDTIYQISVDCKTKGLNNLTITHNGMDDTSTVYNSFMMSSGVTIDGVDMDVQRVFSENLNHFRLVPSDSGINGGICMLLLDTSSFSLRGDTLGKIMNDTGSNIANRIIPSMVSSSIPTSQYDKTILETVTITYVPPVDATWDFECDILVTELVPAFTDYTAIVDANPVGVIVERYGTGNFPGYSRLDGSELSTVAYSDLFNFVHDNNLYLSMSEYQNQIDNQGYTDYFGYDESELVFVLPKDAGNNALINKFIKITPVTVPKQSQLIYNLVWE